MSTKPPVGTFLIPDERYLYSLQIDKVSSFLTDFMGNQTPRPDGHFRITCTRFDLSEQRDPVLTGRDPMHIHTVKSAEPGRWEEVEPYPEYEDDEGPTTFTEYGQLSLF